jgi:hypothetical protein
MVDYVKRAIVFGIVVGTVLIINEIGGYIFSSKEIDNIRSDSSSTLFYHSADSADTTKYKLPAPKTDSTKLR